MTLPKETRLTIREVALARPRLPPRPVCARCHRLVDRMVVERQEFVGKVKFIVHCHGHVQSVRVDESEAGSIQMGTAFDGRDWWDQVG